MGYSSRQSLCLAGIIAILAAFINYAAVAATYKVGDSDCNQLPAHTPDDDVNYKPGVSTEGWAVAPADLNPPVLGAEDFDSVNLSIDIPVTNYIDEEKYNADFSETEIEAGKLSVGMDGSVKMNDKDLTPKGVEGNCK